MLHKGEIALPKAARPSAAPAAFKAVRREDGWSKIGRDVAETSDFVVGLLSEFNARFSAVPESDPSV